jgi:hypothetical protein
MSRYTEILARLRAATGPNSYLSTWIHTELQPLESHSLFVQDCTASIDAAIALVEEKLPEFNCYSIESSKTIKRGQQVEVSISKNNLPTESQRSAWKFFIVEAPTASLGILIALFTALEEEEKKK